MRQYAKQSSDDPYGKNDISRRYEDDEDVIHDARCTAKDCKHDIHDLEQCHDLTLIKRQYQEIQKPYKYPFPSKCVGCGKTFRAK